MKTLFIKPLCCMALASGILISNSGIANDEVKTIKKKNKQAARSTRASMNNKSVKIFPAIIRKDMHVVSKEKKETQFFVFNTEGEMVINRNMKDSEHFKITGLGKGAYTYHLFEGDAEKASGKFEIR